MQAIEDTTQFDWLRPYSRGVHSYVSDDIPAIFDAYCMVMHPLFLVLSEAIVPDDMSGRSQREKDLIAESIPVSAAFDESQAERVTWRSLAEVCGASFEAGFTPLALGEWREGYLTDEGCPGIPFVQTLVDHLLRDHGRQHGWAWYSCPPSNFGLGIVEMYETAIADLPNLLATFAAPFAPTYMWPEDRSWVWHSDYDASYTLIGGPNRLIDSLEADDQLETIRVSPDTKYRLRAGDPTHLQ